MCLGIYARQTLERDFFFFKQNRMYNITKHYFIKTLRVKGPHYANEARLKKYEVTALFGDKMSLFW